MGNNQHKQSRNGSVKSLDTAQKFQDDSKSFLNRNSSVRSSSGFRLKSLLSLTEDGAKNKTEAAGSQCHSSKENDPYKNSKTVWPSLTFREIPFLPEFQVLGRIYQSNFEVISEISSGSYGKVHKVFHKVDGLIYAMKSISKSKTINDNAVRQIKDEIRILLMCGHHPFLVPCVFHWQNNRNLFIVTPFIDGGDLQQLWQQTGYFEEDLVRIYVAEMVVTLDFLHNAGIIYRDLKMENILIDDRGHIKLIDFGLSKWLSIGDRTKTMCGTLLYMAPEVLNVSEDGYTHAIDWWSLGVLLYALLQGKFPFREMSGEAAEIEFDDPMPSDPACRLIRGLLNRDPRQRLRSFRAMQNHAFFHHFDFETLRLKEIDPMFLLEKQKSKLRSFLEKDPTNLLDNF